jgi:protein tyrosine phosphatase (PTP) superfamily phosphohydrolase (DUF442 family)
MSEALASIRNFLELEANLGTAGQPTEAQYPAIAAAGYDTVVNLALPTSTGALPDEAGLAARLGLAYVAIPIDFEAPAVASALRFFRMLDENRGRRLFVHCAANYRVSALVYAYRVARGRMARDAAAADLRRMWTPNETWARYIEDAIAAAAAAEGPPELP